MVQAKGPDIAIPVGENHEVQAIRYLHTVLLVMPFSRVQLSFLMTQVSRSSGERLIPQPSGTAREKLAGDECFSVLHGSVGLRSVDRASQKIS